MKYYTDKDHNVQYVISFYELISQAFYVHIHFREFVCLLNKSAMAILIFVFFPSGFSVKTTAVKKCKTFPKKMYLIGKKVIWA